MLVLLEHSVSAVPTRLLNVVNPILYCIIYTVFSIVFWEMDHTHVMYPILDWSKPGATTGVIVIVGFVVIPLIHFGFYGLYRLRMKIYKMVSHSRSL